MSSIHHRSAAGRGASPEALARYLRASQEAREAAAMFPAGHHRSNLLAWADAYERLAERVDRPSWRGPG